MIEKINNNEELRLIPNNHSILMLCSNCNIHRQIRAVKARNNCNRNGGTYICKSCKQPESTTFRKEREKHNISCHNCSENFLIAAESIRRNIRNNGHYLCATCSRKKASQEKPKKKPHVSFRPLDQEKHLLRLREVMASDRVRNKISESSVTKWQNDQYKEKLTKTLAENRNPTNIELSLYNILESLGVIFFKESANTCFGHWSFDCLVPKQGNMYKNLLIECQGDYWHELAKKQVRDRQKFTFIEKYFPDYEIIYVWEHEFAIPLRVADRLRIKLCKNIEHEKFNFADCVIRECTKAEIKEFLDAYHYIGGRRSGICVGCYLNGKLIAAAMFSKPVRQNIDFNQPYRELSRLCIHPSYHKKNFASWFLSKTWRYVDCNLVISYADTTMGHTGAVYKASGFQFLYEVRQDYWYVDDGNRVVNKKTVYDRASKYSMKESEYVEKYNLIRKWGGKKLCFAKYLDK